jgi:SpoVK/Ycf46/Vps4 family AAA+-type ATPase
MVDLPDLETRIDILNVTMSGNRIAPDVNITTIAEDLEGYSGSDIKEVCREAVVRVAHEKAMLMESQDSAIAASTDVFSLRPVNTADFTEAMKKLKASVDESGRELQKVLEWNDKYGEVKKKATNKRSSQHLSMYI